MKIRSQQMQAMAEHSRRQLENRMIRRLRESFPKETEGVEEEELREFVAEELDRAGSYEIVTEEDMGAFLDRSVYYGEGWHTSLDWASQILNDPELTGSEKTEELLKYETLSLREE
ncbi:MAG: hypothetical protein WBF17_17740 [Phycisphaerae bacterium]